MTFQTKEDAFNAFEETRQSWLCAARSFLDGHKKGTRLTVDDVREACPPPDGVDGRVMGVVFKGQPWRVVEYRASHRTTCHRRPVAVFEKF